MALCCLRAIAALETWYAWFTNTLDTTPVHPKLTCDRSFYLGPYRGDGSETHVPEDTILVQEFRRGHQVKRTVTYDEEAIVPYVGDPFRPVHAPWVWIGDDSTDVDLTPTIARYLVPGNLITLELIFNFLSVKDNTNIVYIDSRTFVEHPFPVEGIRIHAA
jgi:hypothetical protein